MTEPETLQQIDRTCVRFRNRKLSYFSGCDYFRLASHPKVLAAAAAGLEKFGLNVAASRMTTGNHSLYRALEETLADYFKAEAALLVSGGYLTNLVVAQALAGEFTHVLIDEKAHASLADASGFFECAVVRFKHRDPKSLAATVQACGPSSRLILLTDGMFSHDGSVALLAEYLTSLPGNAFILVDDAHGAGVLGKTGKGALEHAGVNRDRMIQTITLSKAFGAYGGAILATKTLRQQILDHSRLFVASTPLPLPMAAAALQSVKILKANKSLRRNLVRNTQYLKNVLSQADFSLPETPGPIVPVVPKSEEQARLLSKALLKAGIYPPFIRYPNGPTGGYFRFVISSQHSREQLDDLARVLVSWDPRS
jgi:7-keto-8-aminopelargonate synthetase-like enzyme